VKIYDVWAEWCPPCKKFGPIFESVSMKFPEVEFVKINADSEEGFAILNKYRINSIPTILIVDENEHVIFAHAGILSEPVFTNLVSTYYLQTQ
jgi:thioredoxin 1